MYNLCRMSRYSSCLSICFKVYILPAWLTIACLILLDRYKQVDIRTRSSVNYISPSYQDIYHEYQLQSCAVSLLITNEYNSEASCTICTIRYSNIAYEHDSNQIVIFYKTGLGDHVTMSFRGFNFNWPPEGLGIIFNRRVQAWRSQPEWTNTFFSIPSVKDDAEYHMCQCGHKRCIGGRGYPTREFTCGVIKPNCIRKVAPPYLLTVWTSNLLECSL